MCAWLNSTPPSVAGSTRGGAQFRWRNSLSPWKRPQSRSTRCAPSSKRCCEPVTVPAAPRKVSVALTRPPAFRERPPGRTGGGFLERSGVPGRDEPRYVEPRLHARRLLAAHPRPWMLRHEERAADGVRLDRGLEGPERPRLIGDLELVHADQRAQEG